MVADDGKTVVAAIPDECGTHAHNHGGGRASSSPVTVGKKWRLCGSCTNLHDTFVKLMMKYNQPLLDAVAMVSQTPARIARIENVGSLAKGWRGDLVVLDNASNNYAVQYTAVGGKVVYPSCLSQK